VNDVSNTTLGKKTKFVWILILIVFIAFSMFLLFSMDFIRDLFGLQSSTTFNFEEIFDIIIIIIAIAVTIITAISTLIFIYNLLPLNGELVESYILHQKKKFLPRYRTTYIIKVKGLPRRSIKENNINNNNSEGDYYLKWDIVSSLAQVCDELSYWIFKYKNRVYIFFSISGWSWFSKERAITKAEQGYISLQSSFKNIYPSILFENVNIKEANIFLSILSNCSFGMEIKGVPAQKTNQNQIDRIINTINNMNEECFFVVSLSKIMKGKEKNNRIKSNNKSEIFEYNEDFNDAKKTGQSKGSVYAFAKTEEGMYNLFAAVLSIWSGTHSFRVEKMGDSYNKRIYNLIKKLNPRKTLRLSNKAFSSFIQLPEKPFLAEDTDQPIFEIPSYQINKSQKEISIGNLVQNEKILDEYSISLENLLYNTEIVGMIGRGKTYLTATIIEQLLNIDLGCLVFDLKGEYARLFANEPSVIVYTIGEPAPLGINLFKMQSDDDVQNILALICEMLTIAGAPFSPTMLNIFENALQKISIRRKQDIEEFMICLYDSSEEYSKLMKTSYARESIDAILNRLNYIFGGINYEVFNALNNTINFSDLDNGNKIILDLSEFLRRGASTASLFLVCNLILHLLSKHASMIGITNKLRYLVILEEAMYLIPKRFNLESSASFGYSEQNFIMGRSLGIGTISIYQLWDSVSSVVHANSLTKILFRGEDIEKIKSSVILTEDQLNYLPFLPDRHFIIKSKSLTGPALLKTSDFFRRQISDKEYIQIISKKFEKMDIQYDKIQKSLTEIRLSAFDVRKNTSNFNKDNPNNERSIKTEKAPKMSQLIDFEDNISNNYWENCISLCPARLQYKNKHSIWIKEAVCKDTLKVTRDIVTKIVENTNLSPLINIIEKNPKYFTLKIMNSFGNNNSINPSIATFCAANLILDSLRKSLNLSYSWKNSILNKIKAIIIEESITKH